MIVLQASHIYKSFGADQCLTDVTLALHEGEKIGLVGRNGAGKTTLLKILTGELPQDSGEVIRPKTIDYGYLVQQGGLASQLPVWEEMLSVFSGHIAMEQQLGFLEQEMGLPENLSNPPALHRITAEYTNLRDLFDQNGGYGYKAAIRGVLHGLRFGEEYYSFPVRQLSGGEKTRLALAKLLLAKPGVLILDEPANYLDMDTFAWLEKYLQTYPGAIMVVSHDRYFLDTVVSVIYELEYTRLKRYAGNYSRYLNLKKEELLLQAKLYRKQQEEVARLQDFVQRNIARASTTGRAKSKQKLLEKIKPLEMPAEGTKKISLNLAASRLSGKEVLWTQDLAVGYPGRILSKQITLAIVRGERIALVGPNGIGKTTLLKTLAGLLPPLAGSISRGYHLKLGYYAQEQIHLREQSNVLNELWDDYPGLDEQSARSVLGSFLFTGDEVLKNVGELSGGEKSRLALAKLMCLRANVLFLDEPTSHLDIPGKEVLEEALHKFSGAVLFVSHDRYFINQVAHRVLELTPQGVHNYLGNFDDYARKKTELEKANKDNARLTSKFSQPANPNSKKEYLEQKERQREERKRQRRIEDLEALISQTENKIAELEKQLYLPDVYNDHIMYRQKTNELGKLKAALEDYMGKWVELS